MGINTDDIDEVEICGVDPKDYPDFVDAYISDAKFKCGKSLTIDELDELNEDQEHADFVYESVFNSIY